METTRFKLLQNFNTIWNDIWDTTKKTPLWKFCCRKTPQLALELLNKNHSSEAIILLGNVNYCNKIVNLFQKKNISCILKVSFVYNSTTIHEDNSLLYEALCQKYFINHMILNNFSPHLIGNYALKYYPISSFMNNKNSLLVQQLFSKEILIVDDENDIRYNQKVQNEGEVLEDNSWKYKGIFQDLIWIDSHKLHYQEDDDDNNSNIAEITKRSRKKRTYYPYKRIQFSVMEHSPGKQLEFWMKKKRPIYEWRNILFQIVWTLECFNRYDFRHNDLHTSNIFIEEFDTEQTYHYIVNENDTVTITSKYCVKIFDYNFASIYPRKKHRIAPENYEIFKNELKKRSNHEIYINTSLEDRKFKNYYGSTNRKNKHYDMFSCFYYIYYELYFQKYSVQSDIKSFLNDCIHPGLLHFSFDAVKGWKGRLAIPEKFARYKYKEFYSKKDRSIYKFMKKWRHGEICPKHVFQEPNETDPEAWFIRTNSDILSNSFFDEIYNESTKEEIEQSNNVFRLPKKIES